MVPARVENLKYDHDFNGLFKDNSSDSEVNCSVVKITWDPPSNYNETAIDHYEVTIHVGSGIQHINVINTEWTFIPSVYIKMATNLSVNVSVSAFDICGQNGTSSTLPINIGSDLFCCDRRDPTIDAMNSYCCAIPCGVLTIIVIVGLVIVLSGMSYCNRRTLPCKLIITKAYSPC